MMQNLPPVFSGLLIVVLVSLGSAPDEPQTLDGGARAPDGGAPAPNCLTSSCHADVTRHERVHQPVRVGRCDRCHTPMEGATPFEAGPGHAFQRLTDNPEVCYACHESLADEAFVHEPVRLGLCVLCHDPHGSERPALLRVDSDRDLCMQCHRATSDPGDRVHGPVQAGACGACHDPHQSPNRFRIRGAGVDQCGSCHATDLPSIVGASYVHAPVADRCGNCHEPHVSPNAFRLIRPPPQLCLDCHDDIRTQVRRRPVVHKPVGEGKCLDCHEQHSSDYTRLLRARLAPEPYEAFNVKQYALCYRCHDAAQVTEPRTTTATGFRNGDVNLHYTHVHRDEKGRTCGLCHEFHAATNPRLIRDATPFGSWQIPLNFEKTETGGSCMPGCHRGRGYDRVRPVENR